jgi:CheY-like chemotaxis protein
METNKLDIEKITINIETFLYELNNIYQILAKENHNKFNLVICDSIHDFHDNKFIVIDPTRLTQILNNLINNAFKFTRNGIVTLSVNKIDSMLKFEISDTGIGISEEHIKKLFSPYQQGDISVNRRFGGTGLGLSICKNLTNLMHGKISCTSEVGIGSIFTFCIPFEKGVPFIDVDKIENKNTKFIGNVLVAEDNFINQKVIQKLLVETYGLNVTIVENGEHALSVYNTNDTIFDVIFMDVQMPVMNGCEATKILRSNGVTTPIIAFSASVLKDERDMYFECGMNDFLAKPIIKDDLTFLLNKYLKCV